MGVILDQVGALLLKDVILRVRFAKSTCCLLLCPALMLLLGSIAVFFVEDVPVIQPFETDPISGFRSAVGSTYPFDPFPLDCGEVSLATGDDGPSDWRKEAQPKMEEAYKTNFECFLDSLAPIVPFWRNMVLQLRQRPGWVPKSQTFALAPGISEDANTLGGRMEK